MQSDLFYCRIYMFRVSPHPSSGLLKTVTAAFGTGHNIGTATSLRRDQIGTQSHTFQPILSQPVHQMATYRVSTF